MNSPAFVVLGDLVNWKVPAFSMASGFGYAIIRMVWDTWDIERERDWEESKVEVWRRVVFRNWATTFDAHHSICMLEKKYGPLTVAEFFNVAGESFFVPVTLNFGSGIASDCMFELTCATDPIGC